MTWMPVTPMPPPARWPVHPCWTVACPYYAPYPPYHLPFFTEPANPHATNLGRCTVGCQPCPLQALAQVAVQTSKI